MEEVWKSIDGYEGYYEVSDIGRVRSLDRQINSRRGFSFIKYGQIMKPTKSKDGYMTVKLSKDGHCERIAVHRLVARAFVSGWFDGAEVNHKDFDRANNCASNLEWVTNYENIVYSRSAHRGRAIKVVLSDSEGEDLIFESIMKCAEYIISDLGLRYKCSSVQNKITKAIRYGTMCYGFYIHIA